MGVRLARPLDHALEALDLVAQTLATRLGPLDPQRELEVLFVADEDIRDARDLMEDGPQLLFASLPERGAVVQIERDARAVLLGRPRDLQAKCPGLRGQRADQA